MTTVSPRTRLLLLLATGLGSGCTSTVAPPAEVDDPVFVQLSTGGRDERHAALLLSDAQGRVIEYAFGDWSWYALSRDECWRAPGALLAPGPGALGRRDVGAEELARLAAGLEPARVTAIRVSRARATKLRARLEAEFAAGGETRYNADRDMWFVRHRRSFWLLHDCNDEMAEWLEELDCSVSWAPIRARLVMVAPPGP
jgi:hypothetical protein